MSDGSDDPLRDFSEANLPKTEKAIMQLKDLRYAPYNPRIDIKPGDEVYEKLKQSIITFGLVDKGIVFNKRTKCLVGGHQRVKVLKDLFGESYRVEVQVVDLPVEKEKVLNLALNKITNDWEPVKLKDILAELSLVAPDDLGLTGFDPKEIDRILDGQLEEAEDDEEDFKMFDAVETEFKCPSCGYKWSGKKK
jgi:ParB-like chromosome segregation protein Spo0J